MAKGIILRLLIMSITVVIGCDSLSHLSESNAVDTTSDAAGSNESSGRLSQTSRSKSGWYSDTKPAVNMVGESQDILGISLRAKDSGAVLFITCSLDSISIDWPHAQMLGAGETVTVRERFFNRGNALPPFYAEWEGSYTSRKRIVRYTLTSFGFASGTRSQDNGDFIREMADSESLQISYDENDAIWSLFGLKEALGEHCP